MKIAKTMAVLITATIALAANGAWAEPCNGHVVSKPLPSILMREAPDGSKVMWVSSEGLFIVTQPENHPANWVNRVCGGGMKIAPDGKGAAGEGSCSYADMEGDVFHLAWQLSSDGGTWQVTDGTGKFEKMSGGGTFKPRERYDNLWGGSTWEGECGFDG